jgi:hypothetical protein
MCRYNLLMKKPAKIDQVLTLLGDIVDIFGRRFDKLEATLATKEQLSIVQTQVNSIENQLHDMRYGQLQDRVSNIEVKVFGSSRE